MLNCPMMRSNKYSPFANIRSRYVLLCILQGQGKIELVFSKSNERFESTECHTFHTFNLCFKSPKLVACQLAWFRNTCCVQRTGVDCGHYCPTRHPQVIFMKFPITEQSYFQHNILSAAESYQRQEPTLIKINSCSQVQYSASSNSG